MEHKQVWIFLRLENPGPETQIQLRWKRGGRDRGGLKLKLGHSPNWRTWARRRFQPGDEGHWRVEVLDSAGLLLEEVAYELQGVEVKQEPEPPPKPQRRSELQAPLESSKPLDTALEQTPDSCRVLALLRLKTLDPEARYSVAQINIAAQPKIQRAPGLLLRDAQTFYTLRVWRQSEHEESREGEIERVWDLLLAQRLPGGPVQIWQGYPAHLPPPRQPLPAGLSFEESNTLEILGILGPFIGLDAQLRGFHEGGAFDHSRYLSLRAPGRSVHMGRLLDQDLQRGFGLKDSAQDLRKIALSLRAEPPLLLSRLKGEQRALPLKLPERLGLQLPQKGRYSMTCGNLGLRGEALWVQAKREKEQRLKTPPLLGLLGVIWLRMGEESPLELHRMRWKSMAPSP